jgi:hypothetical protein
MKKKRLLLGTNSKFGSRTRIYLTNAAIEVDELDGYTGTRKRVLFDEVLLVTYDRRRRGSIVTTALLSYALSAGIAALMLAARAPIAAYAIPAALSMPFVIVLIYHLAFGANCITVFGKRTTAQGFMWGRRRAQTTFNLLQKRVAQVQERERIAKSPPPPEAPSSY